MVYPGSIGAAITGAHYLVAIRVLAVLRCVAPEGGEGLLTSGAANVCGAAIER
jgi:hypothetical protein